MQLVTGPCCTSASRDTGLRGKTEKPKALCDEASDHAFGFTFCLSLTYKALPSRGYLPVLWIASAAPQCLVAMLVPLPDCSCPSLCLFAFWASVNVSPWWCRIELIPFTTTGLEETMRQLTKVILVRWKRWVSALWSPLDKVIVR